MGAIHEAPGEQQHLLPVPDHTGWAAGPVQLGPYEVPGPVDVYVQYPRQAATSHWGGGREGEGGERGVDEVQRGTGGLAVETNPPTDRRVKEWGGE